MHWAKNSQFLYFKYRIYSINSPGRLLNFLDLENGRLLSVVCIFRNKTINGNKKTPEGVYAGCVGVRKNYRYVEWQWKVEYFMQQICAGETEMFC